MNVTLLSSCGLLIEQDGQALLIDALNKQFRCYYGLPPGTFSRMLAGEPPCRSVMKCRASSGRFTRLPPFTGSITMTGLPCLAHTSQHCRP